MQSVFRTVVPTRPTSPLAPATYRTVAVITLTIVAVALSYGAISEASGFAWWQTLLLAIFALSGAAEFTFVGVIAAGGAPILAVLAGLLVNSRNFAFGLGVGAFFPHDWRALFAAHWVNDESVAVARSQNSRRARWHAFLLMGAAIALMWPGGAMLGQWLGRVVDTDSLGLDAAFPIILFCLIRGDLRDRRMLLLAGTGVLLALGLTPVLPLGLGSVTSLAVFVLIGLWWLLRRALRRTRTTPVPTTHLDKGAR